MFVLDVFRGTVFEIVQSACPASSLSKDVDHGTNAATLAKTSMLVKIAFPSLQLICSDFLAALTTNELQLGIASLADFGRQVDDINVALTVSCVGQLGCEMLTLCDLLPGGRLALASL